MALLQVVEDDLHLCAGAHEESEGDEDYRADVDRWGDESAGGSTFFEDIQEGRSRLGLLRGDRGLLSAVNVLDPGSGKSNSTQHPEKKGPKEIHVTPSHGGTVPSEYDGLDMYGQSHTSSSRNTFFPSREPIAPNADLEIHTSSRHPGQAGAVLVRDQGPRGPNFDDAPRRRQVRRGVQRRP